MILHTDGKFYPEGQTPEALDRMRAERENAAAAPERARREREKQGIVLTDSEMKAVAISMNLPPTLAGN